MKCSRVALSLLMAAFGGAVIALGPTEGRGTSAADFGPQPPPCMDSLGYENQYQGATDWRDIDAAEPHYGEYRQEEQEERASTHEAYRSNFEGEEPTTDSAGDSSGMTPDSGATTDGTTTDGTTDGTSDPADASGTTGDDRVSDGMDGSDPAATDEATEEATDEAEEQDEDASHHYGCEPAQSPYGYGYDYYRNGQSGSDYSNQYEYSYPTEKYGYWDTVTEADAANQQAENPQADQYEYDYTHDDFRVGDPDFVPYVPSDFATDVAPSEPEQAEENASDSMSGVEGEGYDANSGNRAEEPTGDQSAESTYNDGDASAPTSESSGSESYSNDAYMPGSDAGESSGSESYGNDAYVPAEDTGEAYRSETYNSDAGMADSDAGQSSDSGSESAETPSYESGTDYSRGHDEGDHTADQVDLSAYLPGELLSTDDQELLRRLSGMLYEDSEARRSVLNNYLESEYSDILGLANRLKESTGTEVLGLADNLPGAAAFLAVFRLVERSDLNMDQAVVVLQESLASPSQQWISEVDAIANGSEDESTASVSDDPCMGVSYPAQGRSVLEIAKAWSTHSLSNFDGAIRNISLPMVWFDLSSLTSDGSDERTAADSARAGEPTSF